MKIVTSDQMRAIEDRSEEAGVSKDTLMEIAGLAVAKRVRHHTGHVTGVPIVVLVGPGNNGADGLVTARHLHNWGARVLIYLTRDRRAPDPKLDIVRDLDVPIESSSHDDGLGKLKQALGSAHVVIDAILGIGRARPIEGTIKDILFELARARSAHPNMRIVAMDQPTGLNADTGELDPATVTADVTVTLGYPKTGHFAFPGADKVGTLEIEEIGLPEGLDGDVTLRLMTPTWASSRLPNRPSSSHKGTFGRTMIVAGSRNYLGAAYLAATAATRVGAGLVTIAIPHSLQMAVAAKSIEPTFLPLPEASPGVVSPDAASMVLDALIGYDALLVGCGLGQEPETVAFAERLLYSKVTLPPAIVDADGLNILAKSENWWDRFPGNAVITPHPGEMARLTRHPGGAAREDRVGIATGFAASWNKVTVLKGAFTVVATPKGDAMLSPFANPGLASAGTGDVLSGIIAGLLSQGLTLEDAASLGVYIHGRAGDAVRDEFGDTGMIASDLLPLIPRTIKALREKANQWHS